MHLPFSQPWADAFCAAINASEEFRAAARAWSWPVALVMPKRPDLGFASDVAVQLALASGRCESAAAVVADAVSAPFVLQADYGTWKQLARGELDPVSALMRGRLALTRGALTSLMMHARAATAIVACAREVPTRFPDEDRSAEPSAAAAR